MKAVLVGLSVTPQGSAASRSEAKAVKQTPNGVSKEV